ncbi:hypothetical protein DPMN_181549 [Dreissena polymorpha]|uniref:Uncharacterized protein n=1 Tax=Dreissena polymorpha TaxID=45954 RepID=A0A9D4DFI3_DREPO|nr:hypothetical protein DPMN_181549 [Dreissena polymorpha]
MNESTGIAYHQGHLFITSGTALHEYEINGTWLRQLYEDTSDSRTVWKSVVSPAGDKVYVSQPSLHRLLTLDRNGKILATFHDLGLLRPWGVCVAPEGQIIVCGDASDTVMLVDRDGKRKLATIATYSNGLRWPWSVYYTKNTDAIIVGQWYDKIVVLKIKEREKGPFIRLKCQKDKFLILKYTCETIEGLLTICGQDLEAHALLDEKLHSFVSADYIQVYTTEHLLNHFETFEMEENQGMSANSVVAAIAQTSTLSLIIVKDDMCESIVNALKKSVICNSGVLIVGNMKQKDSLDIPNVFFGMTESEKILKEADYVLERCAFGIFKTVIIKLKEFAENSGIFSELKNASLQEVYTSVRACFENASIPGPECPDIPLQTFEYPENIDMAIDAVKSIPSIIGCVKKSGRLQIYIEAGAANSEVEKNVQRELDYYNVIKKDFVYRSVKPLCSSGDSAFGGIGTLGGFVVKNDNLPDASVKYLRETSSFKPMTEAAASAANTYRLVALVARHVAIASGAANLTVGNDLLEIGHFGQIGIAGGIDVLPVDVYEECEQYCDTRFKTELGVSMTTTQLPSREDILTRIGAYTPVHIWGAHSAPGLGTLTPEIFHAANGDYIKIRDRRADVLFANEGDSGAMVCYFDAHREVLYAVAVLISQVEDLQVQKREYLAHILDIALQKLSILNGNNYVFIGDRDP